MKKKIKLQIFYILLALFNTLYFLCFPRVLRLFLLKLAGGKIGKRSNIQNVKFFSFGKLKVGNNSIINSGCYLDNRRGISIGHQVVIAHDCKLYTLGHIIDSSNFKTKGAPIEIKDYAILFSNVLIMPGVTIEEGSVVLPGSIVTKNIPPMSIYGGNPAKFIRKREIIHKEREPFNYWFSI